MESSLTFTEKVLAYLVGVLIATAVVLALNVIPWLLWNHGIAPLFNWRTFTFWQMFLITWALSWVGMIVFPRSTKQ